jgi:REP element-mobilizing transposase RayT
MQLFEITQSYDLVYKWFDVLKSSGHNILGYVIMPNHVHALIAFGETKKSINTITGNGKRFIAYGIVEKLERTNKTQLLKILSDGVAVSDRKRGKLHEVFEPSFDMKLCRSYKFVKQKLDYMHSNPVSKKWMLVKDIIDYTHSSAKFYGKGVRGVYEVLHANEWMSDNWTNMYPREELTK